MAVIPSSYKQVKKCKKCGEIKPLEAFYANPGGRDGRRPECKECNRESRRERYLENRERVIARVVAWQRDNRERYNARQRAYRQTNRDKDWPGYLRRNFGLTVEQYDAFVEAHDRRCAICGEAAPESKRHHLDHHHEENYVRGLLCIRCNNGLGQFRERADLLHTAADYLDSGGFVPSGTVELESLAREHALALRRPAA